MPGELSDRNHVRSLLELQRLVIRKGRLGVDDQVRIHGTVFILSIDLWALANAW